MLQLLQYNWVLASQRHSNYNQDGVDDDRKLWSLVQNKEIPEMNSSVVFSLPALEFHFFQTKFHTLLSGAHLPSLADLKTQRIVFNNVKTFKV